MRAVKEAKGQDASLHYLQGRQVMMNLRDQLGEVLAGEKDVIEYVLLSSEAPLGL